MLRFRDRFLKCNPSISIQDPLWADKPSASDSVGSVLLGNQFLGLVVDRHPSLSSVNFQGVDTRGSFF